MRRPGRAIPSVLLFVVLVLPGTAGAGGDHQKPSTPVDRWHAERRFYSMGPEAGEGGALRLGLCPGVGVRAGSPGGLTGVADLYLSASRRRSFSLFAGVGVEAGDALRSVVYTVGWGGVRTIHVARYQTGFFGAFLRYRDFRGQTARTRRDAVSAGTELGAGHLGFTFEVGVSRRVDGQWKALVYAGFKVIWAIPLGW